MTPEEATDFVAAQLAEVTAGRVPVTDAAVTNKISKLLMHSDRNVRVATTSYMAKVS